jgi:hypothetical protein
MGRAAGGLTAAMASMYGLGACCMMMGREEARQARILFQEKKFAIFGRTCFFLASHFWMHALFPDASKNRF